MQEKQVLDITVDVGLAREERVQAPDVGRGGDDQGTGAKPLPLHPAGGGGDDEQGGDQNAREGSQADPTGAGPQHAWIVAQA